MPTRFLSHSEIERLESFPEEIDRDDLAEHFRLAGKDLEFVRSQYGSEGQLGIAVQLCALRWLGFVPEDLSAAPAAAVQSLAATLDVPARALFDYSVRPQTRREHRSLVRGHAGWRTFGEAEQAAVGGWLVGMALEHERPTLLLAELRRELRSRRIERPAIDRLERLVAWARERAHDRTSRPHLRAAGRAADPGGTSWAGCVDRSGAVAGGSDAAVVVAFAADQHHRGSDASRAQEARLGDRAGGRGSAGSLSAAAEPDDVACADRPANHQPGAVASG